MSSEIPLIRAEPELTERLTDPLEQVHLRGSFISACYRRIRGFGLPLMIFGDVSDFGEKIDREERLLFKNHVFGAVTNPQYFLEYGDAPGIGTFLEGVEDDPEIPAKFKPRTPKSLHEVIQLHLKRGIIFDTREQEGTPIRTLVYSSRKPWFQRELDTVAMDGEYHFKRYSIEMINDSFAVQEES